MAPIKRNKLIKVIKFASKPRKLISLLEKFETCWKTSSKFNVPKYKNIKNTPMARPKSPIQLTKKAFIAALLADSLLYQKPIKR